MYICLLKDGYLDSAVIPVDPMSSCPSNWVFVEELPPNIEEGQFLKYDGQWSIDNVGPQEPAIKVPFKVHKYWLTKVLEAAGLMDDIEDGLDNLASQGIRSPRRDWITATEIQRDNILLNQFATNMSITQEQVDQMFIQAEAYQNASGQT